MTSTVTSSLHLLGRFALRVDGREVTGLPRKAKALLAFLALQPDRCISRDLLADLLWTESGQEQARHSLRQLLVVLRRTPAGDLVRTDGDKLWIDGFSVVVDALTLEAELAEGDPAALASAASRSGGALLEDLPTISPAFEEWLWPQRARLAGVMAQALRRLAVSQAASGAFDAATTIAERLLHMDPLDEPAHRLLMDCLARAGRRAAALQLFDRCVRTLREELDVEPETETVALAERIRGDLGLADGNAMPRVHPDDAGTRETAHPSDPQDAAAINAATMPLAAVAISTGRRRRLSANFVGVVLVVLLAVLSLGFAVWPSSRLPPAIAVAFRNVSGVMTEGVVVAGFTDLLKLRLATEQHLRLADEPRTDHQDKPGSETGRERAAAPYRLEGTESFDTDAMHVTVRLADIRTGTELWSDRYDRPSSDASLVADEIAAHAARAVVQDRDLVVTGQQAPIADPHRVAQDRVAQDLVALGYQTDYFRTSVNPAAQDIYRLALTFDKDDVDAMARLATAYVRTALAHSPLDTTALAEADADLQRAIVLDPRNAFVLYNACLVRRLQDRVSEAIAMCKRALDIDPRYPPALRELGHDLLEAGDAEQAIASYQAAIGAGPYLPLVHNAFKGLGVASVALGRRADAIAAFQKSADLDVAHEDDEQLWLAATLEMEGKRVEAAKMLGEFTARHPGLHVDSGYLRLLGAPAYADRRKEVLAALTSVAQFRQSLGMARNSQ